MVLQTVKIGEPEKSVREKIFDFYLENEDIKAVFTKSILPDRTEVTVYFFKEGFLQRYLKQVSIWINVNKEYSTIESVVSEYKDELIRIFGKDEDLSDVGKLVSNNDKYDDVYTWNVDQDKIRLGYKTNKEDVESGYDIVIEKWNLLLADYEDWEADGGLS